jgi:hypothetical protein
VNSRAVWARHLTAAVLLVAPIWCAYGVEGGLGRSITGLQVTDYAGVVPPEPGWGVSLGYVHYTGDLSASRQVPISGQAVLGMKATFDLYSANALYIWPTGEGQWNFASLVSIPFANVDTTAGLDVGARQATISDGFRGDLYDISVVPVIASYHFDKTHHLGLALYISAPTGKFDTNRFANPSLNAWVYSPTVSYTLLASEGTLDWSTAVGVDISSWNHATDYRSGVVFHVDTQLVKHWQNGLALGVTGGWIEQLSDDQGALADRLDGFKGSSLAAGVTAGYQHKVGQSTLALSVRWLHEFDVTRRLKGAPLMVTGSVTF